MEDPLGSIFYYQESSDQLKQKLMDTMVELETMKNMETDLLNLLMTAYKERDQAREQLQCLVKNLVVVPQQQHNNNLVMLQPTKVNSSITESSSPSHVSSPVDSFFETVSSSPEFSYPAWVSYEKHNVDGDVESALIDSLANGKVLPQKGKLLEAVKNAGPLLQNLLLAGPLPRWRNPPPLSAIKIPSFDELKSFPNTLNSIQKSAALPSSHVSQPMPKLNLAGVCSSNSNNMWQFTSSNSSIKKQRLQYF